VLVLAILVILSLLASGVAVTADRLRRQEDERQAALRAAVDMADTRASVLYLLLTQRRTFGGLTVDDRVVLSLDERIAARDGDDTLSLVPVGNEITLDGTPHRGLGEARFALQDDRGRIAVNWAPAPVIERFVAREAGQQVPVATLQNLLEDYQDADDLHRLNSLERDGYRARGRPLPSNRALVTPLELRRVAGWGEVLARMSDGRLLDVVTSARSAQINVNTAPSDALVALPGIDEALARRLVDARQLKPFTGMAEVRQILGGAPGGEEYLSLYPMDSGTLKMWAPGGGAVRVLHWTLTLFDREGRPWREDYEFALSQDDRPDDGVARPTAAKVLARPEAAAR
jgi:type II secretory pathway component PulK